MEYEPGQIHEKLQVPIVLELINDFTALLCKDRYRDTNLIDDKLFNLELEIGNIIVIRLFKPHINSSVYVYIDKLIINNVTYDIKQESILSGEFIKLNTDNKVLFNDVTKSYNRNKIINKILYEEM